MSSNEESNEESSSELEGASLDSVVGNLFSDITTYEERKVSELAGFDFKDAAITESTKNFVTRFRTKVSGFLAISLWSSLIIIIAWHLYMIYRVSNDTLRHGTMTQELTLGEGQGLDYTAHDKATTMIGDTAKTLYAVVTPLATSITGFYFVLQRDDSEEEDKVDEEKES